ncbi:MAG: hypothetical protein V7636_875 [Actinomycetota bacterium]
MSARLHRWGPIALVGVVCLLPLFGLWRAPGAPMEEGFMLTFPELVLKGFVPHRDFLHLYGPGDLWLLAAVYKVAGVTLASERVIGYLQQLGVAFGVFAVLRHCVGDDPRARWVAAAGGATAAVIVIPPIGLVALAWVGAVALGLWSLVAAFRAIGDDGVRFAALAGLLGGLALLWRPDLILAVGMSGVVVLVALGARQRRWWAGGAAVGVAPYLFLLVWAGAGNVIEGLFLQPVFDLRGGRRLPIPPSLGHFDGFLQRAGLLAEPPWPFPTLGSPAQLSVWLLLILASTIVLFLGGRAVARRTGDRRLVALALFAAGLLPQAVQRADSTHLAWVSCVPFGLMAGALAALLRGRRSLWLAALAMPVVMLVVVPDFTWRSYSDYVAEGFGQHRSSGAMRNGDRVFYYGRPDAVTAVNALLPVVRRVSKPGDTLFVGTGDLRKTPYSEAFLYYLLPELDPATRYIEMDPGVANATDSGLADEVRHADVLILSSIRDDWNEPNDSRLFGPDEPNQIVKRDFCLVQSFGTGLYGRGLYELYTRCSGADR